MPIPRCEIHYTDHSFQKYCEIKFGINRGVYNTIETWFYEKGIKNILKRRQATLRFLNSVSGHGSGAKLKFGPGGLTAKLNAFWLANHPTL